MSIPTKDKDRAFNLGSDSRIYGYPESFNPYPIKSIAWLYWAMGWRDVDKFWGFEKGLWPIKEIPPTHRKDERRNGKH